MDDDGDIAQSESSSTVFRPFELLPDEIIEKICSHLTFDSLRVAQSLNRRFYLIAGVPMLWRQHCLGEYAYWHERHELSSKLRQSTLTTDWRHLLALRKQHERHVIHPAFERALASVIGRYQNLEKVTNSGYDAKDYLLRQVDCPQALTDHLARRYWAKVALGQIERRLAIIEWTKLRSNDDVSLERALTCIDLSITDRPPMTLEETSSYFDRVAALFVNRYDRTEYSQQTPRSRACLLVGFLRTLDLTGIDDTNHWTDIRNNLISIALLESDHHSLPLISSVIYCAIAQRLDLSASPINFPGRIHCIVSPSRADIDLDGNPIEAEPATGEPNYADHTRYTYLDPSSSAEEVTHTNLVHILRLQAIPPNQFSFFVSPSSTRHMLIRTSNNMAHSAEFASHLYSSVLTHPTTNPDLLPPNLAQVRAAEVGWIVPAHILSLIRMLFNSDPHAYITYLPQVAESTVESHVLDRTSITSHLLPLLPQTADGVNTHRSVNSLLNSKYFNNTQPPQAKRRLPIGGPPNPGNPAYRVGDYFMHRRYNYAALIIGWDLNCAMEETWIQQMGVDGLPNGRNQVFYHVVDQNEGQRYVAEENVRVLGRHDPDWDEFDSNGQRRVVIPDPGVLRVAGKWCRRWDATAERFVSNLLDEYPDD